MPTNVEQGLLLSTQPAPLVLHPDKNSSHSLSVLEVVLWMQAFSMHASASEFVETDQHGLVSLLPLKVLH